MFFVRGGLLAILLLVLAVQPVEARDCVTRNNGQDWSRFSAWRCDNTNNNGPPANVDTVQVTRAINLDVNTANLSGLTVNAGAAITYAANNLTINVQGPLVNDGTITFFNNSGSIDLQGASVWSGGGLFTLDHVDLGSNALTINPGATFTLQLRDPNTPLRNLGSFNNNATPNRTATVQFNNSGNQTLNQNNVQFPNLRISGSGTKTLPGGSVLNILGSLDIDAGTSFVSTDGINLGGNLTIGGTLTPNNGPWTFNGTTTQTISSATSFRRIVVNNPQGISLGGNMTIGDASWGDLTLSSGRIATNAFSVVVPRACGDAWLAGRTAGSWINGNLQLTAPPNNASCFFPVGDANNFAPITFAYPWHAAPLGGSLVGRSDAGDHPDTMGGTSGINKDKSVNRTWSLINGGGATFYSYDGTFQYCASGGSADCATSDVDSGANSSAFVVAEKVGAAWASFTPTAPTTSSRRVSNLSSLGVFAIGETGTVPLSCINDNFAGGLNSALWNVSGTGFTPLVVTPPTVPSNRLRLTDAGGNRATMAQLKKWFPAANNKVVVEFDYYVYGGSGADGVSVVLSDASVPPTPGGYGGSLGYANRGGINGFNGGWLGFGLDEFGNYPNSTEGRRGYPVGYTPPGGANAAAGFYQHSIAVRGSGVGQVSGYALLANSGVVSPVLTTTNAVPNRYRITVDHSNSINAMVSVERNAGSGYVTVIPAFDAKGPSSGQAVVPVNMLLSFAGSTGGSTNFHEIGNVQVCATNVTDPGGSSDAANFECIETGVLPTWSTTARHPLYTKITNANFKFDIVALKSDGTIENNFVAAGGNAKDVTVELFDDTTPPGSCSAYASPVATQTVQYVSGDGGRKTITNNVNLNRAWGKLRCRVTDANASPTVYGCSTDTFSVRPQSFNSVASSANGDSGGTSTNASTVVKAGAAFSLTAGTGKQGYGGLPKIDASRLEWPFVPAGGRPAPGVGTLGGLFTTAANGATGNGASGNAFSYSEVGYFRFQPQGVYDDTFSALSADTTNSDCINTPPNDFSNVLVGGKYGCKFGNTVATSHFGRFIPDRFVATSAGGGAACAAGGFSYMSQPFASPLAMTVEARNSSDVRTQNYSGAFANGVVGIQMENSNSGTAIPTARLNLTNAPAWSGGSYSIAADRFLRDAAGPDGAFDALDIGLSVTDATASSTYLMTRDMDASNAACTTDLTGLSTAAGVCSATRLVAGARVRYGRLWLGNAYGSDRQNLSLPYETQYWNGFAFIRNMQDSCTTLATANVGLGNYQNGVTPGNLPPASVSLGAFASGAGSVQLAAPNASGSVDVRLALGTASGPCSAITSGTSASLAHLGGKWCGSNYDRDPVARATFGISRSNRQIFLREGF